MAWKYGKKAAKKPASYPKSGSFSYAGKKRKVRRKR